MIPVLVSLSCDGCGGALDPVADKDQILCSECRPRDTLPAPSPMTAEDWIDGAAAAFAEDFHGGEAIHGVSKLLDSHGAIAVLEVIRDAADAAIDCDEIPATTRRLEKVRDALNVVLRELLLGGGTKVVHTCSCGTKHTRATWATLKLVGYHEDEVERIEMRNCLCGSTRCVNVPKTGVLT